MKRFVDKRRSLAFVAGALITVVLAASAARQARRARPSRAGAETIGDAPRSFAVPAPSSASLLPLRNVGEFLSGAAQASQRARVRVRINEAPFLVGVERVTRSLDEAMADVARGCERGELTDPSAAQASRDAPRDHDVVPLRLERIVNEDSEPNHLRASLCIFQQVYDAHVADGDAGSEATKTRRVRYTLAYRHEHGATTVTTMASLSPFSLSELFPAHADVPGDDFPDVVRPDRSIRTLSAVVEGDGYSVRIYESALAPHELVSVYTGSMATLGYRVSSRVDDVFVYARPDAGARFVVSFAPSSTDGSVVTITPFRSDAVVQPLGAAR